MWTMVTVGTLVSVITLIAACVLVIGQIFYITGIFSIARTVMSLWCTWQIIIHIWDDVIGMATALIVPCASFV